MTLTDRLDYGKKPPRFIKTFSKREMCISLQGAMNGLLEEGFMPADAHTINTLIDDGEIPSGSYDTGEVLFSDGTRRKATPDELGDLWNLLHDGNELVITEGIPYPDGSRDSTIGIYNLYVDYNFVGVKPGP